MASREAESHVVTVECGGSDADVHTADHRQSSARPSSGRTTVYRPSSLADNRNDLLETWVAFWASLFNLTMAPLGRVFGTRWRRNDDGAGGNDEGKNESGNNNPAEDAVAP